MGGEGIMTAPTCAYCIQKRLDFVQDSDGDEDNYHSCELDLADLDGWNANWGKIADGCGNYEYSQEAYDYYHGGHSPKLHLTLKCTTREN